MTKEEYFNNKVKTRFLLNPFLWFSLVWILVLFIHSFNFLPAYPETSVKMNIFLITIIIISIFLAYLFNSLFLKKLKVININSKPIWLIIIASYVILAFEAVYSKTLPLASVFSSRATYKDFGVPILSGFMYSFCIFISMICSLKLVYGKGNKWPNFIALLLSYGRFVLVFSRGGLIICLAITIIIYFTKSKFNWISILILLILFILGLYFFNILGNIRMGYSSNDSSYLLKISKFNKDYYWLSNFSWGITYIDSPLGNLLYNEANIAPLNSIDGLFSQLLTSVISEKLYPNFSPDMYLTIPNLTVSTMFAGGYKYYGYFGMAIVYLNMVAIIFISCALCKKNNFALMGCAAILTILTATSFFDNMFYTSGNSFALIYLVIYIYAFYKGTKIKPHNNKVVNDAAQKAKSINYSEDSLKVKQTQKNKNTTSLTKNSIAYLIYNIFNALFPFLSALYVTRILSSAAIGEVSYALNIVSYFALFAFVGIPTYGTREIAKYRDNQTKVNRLFTELTIINTITTTISLIAYVSLIFIVPTFREENLILFLVVGIEIALNYFNISWLYEGLEKFTFISIINVISKILSLVFLFAFVHSEGHMILYAILSVIGISGNYLLSFFFYRKCAHFTKTGLSFKEHIKPIILLVVVNLAIEIYSLLDITMIGALIPGKEHVTYYKYAHQIQKTMLMMLNTVTLVLIPRLSKFYKDNKINEYNALLNKTFLIILIISIPMVIGTYFVSDYLLVFLYGSEYIASSAVLKALVPIVIISPIGYLLGSRVCLVTNHEKYMPIAVGVGAIANIGLNILFINLYQETGAAIASFISEIIVFVVYISFSHKYFALEFNWKEYLKILISILLMTVYLILIYILINNETVKFVLEICGAIIIYFSTLLILKEKIAIEALHKFIHRKEDIKQCKN